MNKHVAIGHQGQPVANTDHPLHPGNLIEEELEARGLKKKDVAKALGLHPVHLSELFKEKRHVSAMLAIRLENLFNIEADFWMRIQSNYDLIKARQKISRANKQLAIHAQ